MFTLKKKSLEKIFVPTNFKNNLNKKGKNLGSKILRSVAKRNKKKYQSLK